MLVDLDSDHRALPDLIWDKSLSAGGWLEQAGNLHLSRTFLTSGAVLRRHGPGVQVVQGHLDLLAFLDLKPLAMFQPESLLPPITLPVGSRAITCSSTWFRP